MSPMAFITRCAIRLALRRPAPDSIPRSLPKAKDVNCYVVELGGPDAGWPLLADSIRPRGVEGRWLEGDTYELSASIPNAQLRPMHCQFTHFIGIYEFRYRSALAFLAQEFLLLPQLSILRDKASQFIFNRKTLVRKERVEILRLAIEATVENSKYELHPMSLATRIYSNRWIFHPRKTQILNYFSLLLDSLADSGDLTRKDGGYKLAPKALVTLSQYEEEERKHQAMLVQQRAMKWLTFVLIFVGLLQAFVTWKG